jgi:hypothetical protein
MPTKPNEDFIPRDIYDPDFQEILNQYSSVLEEVVNFASHVAKWCSEKIHGGEELAPIFLSFRHVFELIDAISVLVKHSCIEPCQHLLRSIYESVLSVRYIMEKDAERRGRAFMTCVWHQEINDLRKWNPEDSMHKQLLAKKRKDKLMKDKTFPQIPDAKSRIKILEEHLNSEEYLESENEYQRLRNVIRSKKKDIPRRKTIWQSVAHWFKDIIKKKLKWMPIKKLNWYAMHGGPKNIEGLADYLESPLEYEFRYRKWSGLVHGIDIIMDNIEVVDDSTVYLSQIRLPTNAYDITYTAMNYGLEIIPRYIEMFVPERMQEASDWHSKVIIPIKDSVLKIDRIVVKSPEH